MTWTNEQKTEALEIIKALKTYQTEARLSDGRLVREYPDLGSTKTWRQRMVAENWDSMRPDRMLHRLRRVAAVMDGKLPDAEFYADMPVVRAMGKRLALLESQTSDRRILPVLAANGCGKTTFARWAVAQSPAERVYCRMMPAWRNKELHIANGICRELGADTSTGNAADAEQRLIALLSGQRRTLFLDQAHEGGVALLHLLRALVDETPSRFVYLGYDTAYRRVLVATSDALIEAQAFMGRCLKPVFDAYKAGTRVEDVTEFLKRAADVNHNVASGIATKLMPVLQAHGNLRLLADAIDAARTKSDTDEADPDRIVEMAMRMAGLNPEQAPVKTEEE